MYIQVVLISQITKSLIQVRVHACTYILEIWEFKNIIVWSSYVLRRHVLLGGHFYKFFLVH